MRLYGSIAIGSHRFQSLAGSTSSTRADGTAPPFGTILGTLTARGAPGAKQGTCSWRAQAFAENGDSLFAVGEGTWHESGKHQ